MTRFFLQSGHKKSIPLAVLVLEKAGRLLWCQRAADFPGRVLDLARQDGFQAKPEETFAAHPAGGKPAERLLLVSGGSTAEANAGSLRRAAAAVFRRACEARMPRLAFLVPHQFADLDVEVQAVVEGMVLAGYRFDRHKSRPSPPFSPSEVSLIVPRSDPSLQAAARKGEAFAGAVNFARDLINEPPSLKVPETLGRAARGLAGRGIGVRVFRKADIKRLRMNALLGVNRGSAHPPVLVHMRYRPSGRPQRRLAFVGKGITFDSGGLSLKSADGMMTMKYDMAGAATVFALFKALATLRPPVEVHGIAAVTENMPGPDAYKPGDVVRAANGKTIEILNTDAEGRVILSDALSYASGLTVDEIVDIATLTGAVSVALGKAYAALMTNNDKMEERLKNAASLAGEKLWRLPLEPSYQEHIRSKVADLKNIGNPGEAGTIIGGLFLQEFVKCDSWAHLDIAGAGWSAQGTALGPVGATGVMVRTLLHYICLN